MLDDHVAPHDRIAETEEVDTEVAVLDEVEKCPGMGPRVMDKAAREGVEVDNARRGVPNNDTHAVVDNAAQSAQAVACAAGPSAPPPTEPPLPSLDPELPLALHVASLFLQPSS